MIHKMTQFFTPVNILILLLVCILNVDIQAQEEKQYQPLIIGFYNLENLFDTVDHPQKRDEEFLPNGKNRWDSEKYLHKLKQMSLVIANMGEETKEVGPAILGISEIENQDVIEDLVNQEILVEQNYGIVHYESPDRRGVDVGLIYKKKYFKPFATQSYRLNIPEKDDFYSRDQLVVSGNLLGDTLHIIVNHWPSRRGGEKRSKPLRNAAAELSRHISDSLLSINPDAKIMVMGDFNDNPTDESVKKIMIAKGDQNKLSKGDFYNPFYKLYKQGHGSNAWRDTWSLFDQILISQGLLKKDYSNWQYYKPSIYNKAYLKQKTGRYKGYPSRTFAAGSWQAGYSDHFPVYVILVRELP